MIFFLLWFDFERCFGHHIKGSKLLGIIVPEKHPFVGVA